MSHVRHHSHVVAVVGGGAAGTLVAAQVLRAATKAHATIEVRLIEPRSSVGKGVAYSTEHPDHVLNVPAGRMSALPDDPDHFLTWLESRCRAGYRDVPIEAGRVEPGMFVSRRLYSEYLQDVLGQSIAGSSATFRRFEDAVHAIQRRGEGLIVELASGRSIRATDVVLALGAPQALPATLPSALTRSARYVADPWEERHLSAATADADSVLLVGTGLTMVDIAMRLQRPGLRMTAVSRSGLAPRSHAHEATPTIPVPESAVAGVTSLADARRLVERQLALAAEAGLPWQAAMDSLRGVTNDIWHRLSHQDRQEFLATYMRRWEVLRHRLAPSVARSLASMVHDGDLELTAGDIENCEESSGKLTIRFRGGRSETYDAVVACTGPGVVSRATGSSGTLLRQMIASGLLRPHDLDLGVDVDGEGRGVTSSGQAHEHLWLVGPLRRGVVWETTAISEIRTQAQQVALSIVAPQPRAPRPPRDLYELELSTSDEAANLYNDALGRVLRVQSGAVESLHACLELDPNFALGHAAMAVLGHEFGANVPIKEHIERAVALSDSLTTERERAFIDAYKWRVLGNSRPLLAHLREHPRDTLAMSIAMPTIAFSGVYDVPGDAWHFLESQGRHYGTDWWYQGLLAFGRQEQGRMAEALEFAERSLAVEPCGGNAVHAKAHVHLETGEHAAGLEWLDAWVEDCGRSATHRAHFAWHAALHELALDDTQAVLRRYADQLAPPSVSGTRAMVDSASLLWRLQVEGVPGPLPPASPLVAAAGREINAPQTSFAALHAAVTWAVAGDRDGIERLRTFCKSRKDQAMSVAARVADGLLLYLEGEYLRSADELLAAHSSSEVLGGSLAQREVILDSAIGALINGGNASLARDLLESRLDRRPRPRDHVLVRRAMRSEVREARSA